MIRLTSLYIEQKSVVPRLESRDATHAHLCNIDDGGFFLSHVPDSS